MFQKFIKSGLRARHLFKLSSLLVTLVAVAGLVTQSQPQLQIKISVLQDTWKRIDRQLEWSAPQLLWKGEPLRSPRGIVQVDDALYIMDPGKPEEREQKPARIIQIPLADGKPGKPTVFFERKGFLLSGKWAVPAGGHHYGVKALVVADQGEELPTELCKTGSVCGFTGKGAKVFLLPISKDGKAEEPKILWAGSPLFCPTGVAVVGQFVYVTDPCAGPQRTRPEKPDKPFISSALFAIPLSGGQPTLLWEGDPFTSLIGICDVEHQGKHSLIVHDVDSGRLDPTAAQVRPHGFAPPGAAELWVFDILDLNTAKVAPPKKIPFTEEGPVTLRFEGIPDPDNANIVVTTARGNLFPDRTTQRIFQTRDLDRDGTLKLTIVSPVELEEVSIGAEIINPVTKRPLAQSLFTLRKDPNQSTQFVDNKHRGKLTTLTGLFHFTLDNARGHAAVWIFPEGGDTPVAIAKGPPLVRPLSAQLSPDQKTLWISDESGAFFALPVPDDRTLDALFPYRKR